MGPEWERGDDFGLRESALHHLSTCSLQYIALQRSWIREVLVERAVWLQSGARKWLFYPSSGVLIEFCRLVMVLNANDRDSPFGMFLTLVSWTIF